MKQGSCPPPTYSQTNPVEPRGKYFRRNERDGVREGESGANAIEKFAHKATLTIAFHRSIVEGSLSLSSMDASHVPYFHKRNHGEREEEWMTGDIGKISSHA